MVETCHATTAHHLANLLRNSRRKKCIFNDFTEKNPSNVTALSRGVQSLFGPTRKSSPWGNFSDGGLNQSIKGRLSL